MFLFSCSSVEQTNVSSVSAPESKASTSSNKSSGQLNPTCSLDSENLKILCEVNRKSKESSFLWTYEDKTSRGDKFEFTIYDPIKVETLVTIQECLGPSCGEIVEIVINTAHLAKTGNTKTGNGSSDDSLSSELSATCSIDSQWKISCQAHRTSWESTLSWTYIDRTGGGDKFELSLYEPIMRGPIILEECIGSSCKKIETTVDVSHLAPTNLANKMTMQSEYSRGECDPNGSNVMGSPPMNIDDIVYLTPMGHMQGDHIMPIDHLYVNFTPEKFHDVYAMADGYIVTVGDHGIDHRIIIEHSCDLYSIYIHIDELHEDIESRLEWKFPQENSKGRSQTRIPIKQGDVIGRVIGNDLMCCSFDLAVIDTRVTLSGFVNLASYAGEFWKSHTVDPFDYWDKSFRERLLAKTLNLNENMPGGKIDLDVDGKLAGNWFQEGSGGYSGLRTNDDIHGVGGHLSFAYSILVPDTLWISFGSFGDSGQSEAGGVKGNFPNPAEIGVEDGLVKFVLLPLDHGSGQKIESGYKVVSTGEWWDDESFPGKRNLRAIFRDYPLGVVLVEMIDDRTIKVEVFEDTPVENVVAFTNNFKMYVR